MEATLATAWTRAVTVLGGSGAAAAVSGAELVARYAEAHRRYHGVAHVVAVLRDAEWLGTELGLTVPDAALVAAAACAHDVVYDVRPGVDERASADWAAQALRAAGVGSRSAEVVRLVLATAEHRVDAEDLLGVTLLDADLAILGASPAGYRAYVEAVRAEYAAVPDDAWRVGRSAVLRGLVERDVLYLSEPARDRWEAAARANVAAELAELERSG